MIKRLTIMSFIVLLLGTATVIWLRASSTTTLAEPVVIDQQKGDFILHMRIENNAEGIRVLHSLEYTGEKPITIKHRTPLTYLSFGAEKSNFTGSPISKTIQSGDIYRTTPMRKVFKPLENGSNKLYIHCQFMADDNLVNIRIEKDIKIQ
ncbi:hypothetical protein BN1058_02187 [Paraliobacillus sp. PM-2]|uniref:hypothetical protein n=1 Tax=Paraliobacillus sp. PM-2 TaxID=1462524 RepID=UPI00061BBE6C|nr:hypothetical protein [Paraliobacillus sp. PM-2]CQR47856.1 hypothetical protein BN1058_02187 [Paraliobacillus sp. PM-2]